MKLSNNTANITNDRNFDVSQTPLINIQNKEFRRPHRTSVILKKWARFIGVKSELYHPYQSNQAFTLYNKRSSGLHPN